VPSLVICPEGSLYQMQNKQFRERAILLTDMDEVLCHMTPEWMRRILHNADKFKDHFDLDRIGDELDIMGRSEYYIDRFLLKQGLTECPKHIKDAFMALYTEPDFYQHCAPTEWATAVLAMTSQSYVDQIYVVTRTMPGTEKGKLDWVSEHLPSSKIKLVCVPWEMRKSDAIKELGVNDSYTTFVDDNPREVVDVMDNTLSAGKEFLVPMLGWNAHHPDIMEAAVRNMVTELYFYNPWLDKRIPRVKR